jgi:transcriptional regulator with XRE-family HTH domain
MIDKDFCRCLRRTTRETDMAKDACGGMTGDPAERETRLAEARFVLMAQVEMQRLLNEKGLKYKDLSKRLGVSEARISQMFGDDANNLTARTIAKVFHQLGEKPLIMSRSQFERRLAQARGAADPAPFWTFAGSIEDLNVSPSTQVVHRAAQAREPSRPATGSDWASAERALEARSIDAA